MVEDGIISTVAGSAACGYSGDHGLAVHARLNRPGGVVTDKKGNIFTNDYGNNVIRKIDTKGVITTIAGNGEYGCAGDQAQAIQAKLNKPYGLCVSLDGNYLYIADYGNHSIREVNLRTGIIKTLCGTGKPEYSGDNGPCHSAQLNGPFWVSLHKNDLLIADTNNHMIRKINLTTKIITTIVGNGKPGYMDDPFEITNVRLNTPAGMVVHGSFLFIADYGNNTVRKVNYPG